jgi:RNA-directed DNA polymerase
MTKSSSSAASSATAWFKPRGYLHFDYKAREANAIGYVTDAAKIARHSFFPFLKYVQSVPRYKRTKGKVESKNREICYAGHMDSHVYAYYASLLYPLYEDQIAGTSAEASVLAYRRLGRSNIHFAHDAFTEISNRTESLVLAYDLESFFDSLDHEQLKEAWCRVLTSPQLPSDHYAVFKSVTKYAFADRDQVFNEFGISESHSNNALSRICSPAEFRDRVRGKGLVKRNTNSFGIPQGSPISAMLSNIYMLSFDQAMHALAQQFGGSYRRYCDDILWIGDPGTAGIVEAELKNELKRLSLKINVGKTERVHFSRTASGKLVANRPLQYLGFNFDGQRQIIRSSSIARYFRRMKHSVRLSARDAAKNTRTQIIYRDALYEKYTHLGGRNFIIYGFTAARLMHSVAVRKQLARHWKKLEAELKKRAP